MTSEMGELFNEIRREQQAAKAAALEAATRRFPEFCDRVTAARWDCTLTAPRPDHWLVRDGNGRVVASWWPSSGRVQLRVGAKSRQHQRLDDAIAAIESRLRGGD